MYKKNANLIFYLYGHFPFKLFQWCVWKLTPYDPDPYFVVFSLVTKTVIMGTKMSKILFVNKTCQRLDNYTLLKLCQMLLFNRKTMLVAMAKDTTSLIKQRHYRNHVVHNTEYSFQNQIIYTTFVSWLSLW